MSASADRAFWLGNRSDPDAIDDANEAVYGDGPIGPGVFLAAPPARLSAARATVLVSVGVLLGALAAGCVAWAVASGCIAPAAATPITFTSKNSPGAAR